MGLANLLAQLATVGNVSTGFGPKHPSAPNLSLQPEIDHFLAKYPLLRRDQGYVEFLQTYAAMVIEKSDETLSIDVFGFAPDLTFYLPEPDESIFGDEPFFFFTQIILDLEHKPGHSVGCAFAYDLSGTLPPGVYRSLYFPDTNLQAAFYPPAVKFQSSKYSWYCTNFIQWLDRVVRFQGILLT